MLRLVDCMQDLTEQLDMEAGTITGVPEACVSDVFGLCSTNELVQPPWL